MEYTLGSRTMYSRAAKTKSRDLSQEMLTKSDITEDFEQMCVQEDEEYEPSIVGSDSEDNSDLSSESETEHDDQEMEVYLQH